MQNISIYLEKFKSLGLKERESKDLVAQVVKDLLGIDLKNEDIEYRDGTVCINVSGSVKSAIFLNKEKILDQIQKELKSEKYISKLN